MDLLLMTGLSISMGIILLAMGLSLVSQSLDVESYTDNYWHTTSEGAYYKNPLWHYESKYFHYRPKGTIILNKAKWARIEKNIGAKLLESLDAGKRAGRKETILEIQDRVDMRRDEIVPASPYLMLGVTAATPLDDIEKKYNESMKAHNPVYFKHLDVEFTKLAEIRRDQLTKAWKKIKYGLGERVR
jgi:hypothetical protein